VEIRTGDLKKPRDDKIEYGGGGHSLADTRKNLLDDGGMENHPPAPRRKNRNPNCQGQKKLVGVRDYFKGRLGKKVEYKSLFGGTLASAIRGSELLSLE